MRIVAADVYCCGHSDGTKGMASSGNSFSMFPIIPHPFLPSFLPCSSFIKWRLGLKR